MRARVFRYQKGDVAVVTGDSSGWGHNFKNETRVVLDTKNEEDEDDTAPGWLCYPEDPTADDTGWWVSEADLEVVLSLEAEVAEAIAAIKTRPPPRPHCPTCTCGREKS